MLALLLAALPLVAAHSAAALAALLALLGTTFGGLDLLASGLAAGCVIDEVGGSVHDISTIVGAVSGLGSLASLLAVSGVSALLRLLGWERLFRLFALLGLAAGLVMVPLARPRRRRLQPPLTSPVASPVASPQRKAKVE